MFRTLTHQIRHETRFILVLIQRDLAKRLAALAMISALCLFSGTTTHLPLVLLVIALVEVATLSVYASTRLPDGGLSAGATWILWVASTIAIAAYLAPAVLLASQPSVPMLLTGFIWIFGVMVHESNTFGRMPLYHACQIVASLFSVLATLWVAWDSGYFAGDPVAWSIAMALLVVYCANTIQTTIQQREILTALANTRRDADDRLRALQGLTQRDPLTGLLNRQAFDVSLGRMLEQTLRGTQTGVFLIDLDGFKPVNDSYGHAAGDAVLMAVAERLRSIAGDKGLAARLGGDEFALALPGLSTGGAAMQIAQTTVRSISQPVQWADKMLSVSASVGVALSGLSGNSVTELCATADQAMFRAKGSALRTMLYLPGAFPRRLTPDDRQRLVRALSSGAIRPHYQPKVRLSDGVLIGLEALARWHTADHGVLLPEDFLPQINQMGLQGDFTTTMTARVLAEIDGMLDAGLDPGQVSVNLSESALATQAGLTALQDLLAKHPRAAARLTVEITDSVFTARGADVIRQSLTELRAAGLRVSLDDFSAGFAGFRRLRPMPLDEVKIAPDFVADLGRNGDATVLVRGTIDIARGLGLQVIAEGVETDTQRDQLIGLGARFGQGFLFGAAIPLPETHIRLAAEAMRPAPDAFVPGLALTRTTGQTGSDKPR